MHIGGFLIGSALLMSGVALILSVIGFPLGIALFAAGLQFLLEPGRG